MIALVALPFLADVDRYRGLIEARAEEALGREVGNVRPAVVAPVVAVLLAQE